MPKERQSSFAAGALSENLWGRTDLPQYAQGCRQLLNFFVSQHGVLMNRSGTQHIARLETDANRDGPARLYAFAGTDPDDTLVLVFTDKRVMAFRQNADDPRFAFDVVATVNDCPWDEDDLPKLRFSQDGDELIITANTLPPQLLTRNDDTLALEELSFERVTFPPQTEVLSLHTVTGLNLFDSGLADRREELGLDRTSAIPAEATLDGDESHPRRSWSWYVTRLVRDEDGKLYETFGKSVQDYYIESLVGGIDSSFAGLGDAVSVYPDWPQRVRLSLDLISADSLPEGHVLYGSRIYRGREGRFGYIGETTADFFIDDVDTPDYSDPPPQGRNPFKVYDGDGGLIRTECPAVVAHFEGRRYFGGTPERPSTLFVSAIDELLNFDEVLLPDAEDAMEFRLRGDAHQELRALIPGNRFLAALTRSGQWVVTGSGQEEVIKPGSVAAHLVGTDGCSDTCPALLLDDTILFVDVAGVTPMAMRMSRDGSETADLSILAADLFETFQIVDWAYAKRPYRVLWAVRSDGALLSCTYLPKLGLLAWARHGAAGDGVVESVCVKPEGTEDAVYLSVKRVQDDDSEPRYLERLAYRAWTGDIRDCVHLDRCKTHNGRNTTDAGWSFPFQGVALSSDLEIGESYKISFSGTAPFTLDPDETINQVIILDDPDGGAPYRLLIQFATAEGDGYYAVPLTREIEAGTVLEIESDAWLLCTRSVTGIGYLEGQTVTAVVDGEARPGLVVQGGAISLAEDQHWEDYGAVVHVGLPYNSDFESLDIAQERGKQKAVTRAVIEINRTRGGKVGTVLEDDDTPAGQRMIELRQRATSDNYAVMQPKREEVSVPIPSSWGPYGRVAFRQSEPYPCTLLGVLREYELGG